MSQQKQIIVAVILAVVLVGVILFQVTRKPPGTPANAKTTAAATATTKAAGKAAAPAPASKAATKAPANAAAKPASATGADGKAQEGATAIKQADVDIDTLLAGIKEVDFDYDKNRQPRDPMAPLVGKVANMVAQQDAARAVPAATVGQILNKNVTGIVWDPKTPIAIVDNDIIYPGYEYADGTVVVSIERDRVVFKVGDSPIEVKLKEL